MSARLVHSEGEGRPLDWSRCFFSITSSDELKSNSRTTVSEYKRAQKSSDDQREYGINIELWMQIEYHYRPVLMTMFVSY